MEYMLTNRDKDALGHLCSDLLKVSDLAIKNDNFNDYLLENLSHVFEKSWNDVATEIIFDTGVALPNDEGNKDIDKETGRKQESQNGDYILTDMEKGALGDLSKSLLKVSSLAEESDELHDVFADHSHLFGASLDEMALEIRSALEKQMTIEETAYEAYKVDWMLSCGFTMETMEKELLDQEKYIAVHGHDGSCYKNFDKFMETEYNAKEYIASLLPQADKEEYLHKMEGKGYEEIPGIRYYEVCFSPSASIFIKGFDKPTIKEAEEFCKDAMEFFEENHVMEVKEASFRQVANECDFSFFTSESTRVYENREKSNERFDKKDAKELFIETLKENLPHGSGINGNWDIEYEDGKFVCSNSYDHLNDVGMYDRVIPFTLEIPENNIMEFTVNFNDNDKAFVEDDMLDEYLEDTFADSLREISKKLDEKVKTEGVAIEPSIAQKLHEFSAEGKPELIARTFLEGMATTGCTIDDVQKRMADLQKSVKDIMFKDPDMHKRLKDNEHKEADHSR